MANAAFREFLSEPDRVGAAAFVLSLRAHGVFDIAVLRAIETVPRDLFAPRRFGDLARHDLALPLACGQTMTSPTSVAQMLVALDLRPGQRVLEIGTGSGYVAALLAKLGGAVRSYERRAILCESAQVRLATTELSSHIDLVCGDGLDGEADGSSYDRILLNGSVRSISSALTSRLAGGGRLVAALSGPALPRLVTITRDREGRLANANGAAVRIAPLVEPVLARTDGEINASLT